MPCTNHLSCYLILQGLKFVRKDVEIKYAGNFAYEKLD